MPQGGFVFRPAKNGELKLSAGKGFRVPNLREMYLYGVANPDLKPERLWNYELSWRHRLNNGVRYGLNIFYLKGDNMIQTIPVDGKPRNVNTGEVENWGVEAEFNYPIGRSFDIFANGTFLHMKNKIVAAPEGLANIGVNYHQNKWFASLGLQMIANLYTAVGEEETKENAWLLRASVTYAVTRNISLWVRGENLLAQKYEINLGYPMPRATFMGGVSLNF